MPDDQRNSEKLPFRFAAGRDSLEAVMDIFNISILSFYYNMIITWSTVLQPCIEDMCKWGQFICIPKMSQYKYIQYKPCAKTLATRRAEGLMISDFQVPWFPWLLWRTSSKSSKRLCNWILVCGMEYIATLLEVNIEWEDIPRMKPPRLRILRSHTGPRQHRSD